MHEQTFIQNGSSSLNGRGILANILLLIIDEEY